MLELLTDQEFLTGALGAGGLGAVVKLLHLWLKHRSHKDKTAMRDAIERQNAVYPILSDLHRATGAMSVVIARSENGGGVPHPGKDIYSSIAFEVTTEKWMRNSWQRQPSDQQYRQMLYALLTNGHACVNTQVMPESTLKDIYVTRGVNYAELYLIHQTDKNLFYLILHFKSMPKGIETDALKSMSEGWLAYHTPQYRETVRAACNAIQKLVSVPYE